MRKGRRYSIDHEPQLGIEVIGYHCPIRAEVACPDGIPAYRLMMFHQQVVVQLAQNTYHWPAQTLVIIPPGMPSVYGESGRCITHSWIRANGTRLPQLLQEAQLQVNQPIHFSSADESDRWLSALIREWQEPHTRFEIVYSLLRIWLATIQRHAHLHGVASISVGLRRARQAIEEGCLEKRSLIEYARIAGYSRAHFSVQYKKAYGISPAQHLMRLKIDHACELLENANLSIAEIAEQTRFCDLYYFSRVFKQLTGFSPTQFRQRSRQAGLESRDSSSWQKPGHEGKVRARHS